MAKGLVRDMVTAAMAIKRGDAKRIATEFRPSQGPFVRMKDFSNSPLREIPGAVSYASCLFRKCGRRRPRRAGGRVGRESEVVEIS